MRSRSYSAWRAISIQARHLAGRIRKDKRGFTAVEFAMVAPPFLMLLFGTIAVGLYFFVTFSLENAVEQSARLIRTGQAQSQDPPMTTTQFKAKVCSYAPSFVDCKNKLRVNVVTSATFSGLTEPACLDKGKLIADPAPKNVPGAANDIVLVTVCYEWDLAGQFPFLKLGTMANGAALIRAATTFRTEPYE